MASKLVAFVTSDEFPNLTEDDLLAKAALEERNIQVNPAIWNDSREDWSDYSAVVIRSCWDYHHKTEEFQLWLDELEWGKVPLWNSVKTVRWNMNKTYLDHLQQKGFPVLDSIWLTGGKSLDLSSLMIERDWQRVVVKPVISAAARNTYLVDLQDAADYQSKFSSIQNTGGVIVQEFAEEIQTTGEWSLVFFNKKYNHSVIKVPQNGDFRVQLDFGGTANTSEAPDQLIRQAQKVVDSIPEDLLYARVDGIDRNGTLTLMELEVIEPHLFFGFESNAPDRFASSLVELMNWKELRQ